MPQQRKTEKVGLTASSTGIDDKIAKGASPEDVEAANEEAREVQTEAKIAALEDEVARAKGEGASERVYVEDDDGITRLAAAEGQRVPEWAEKMKERSGGESNTPARSGPEQTA